MERELSPAVCSMLQTIREASDRIDAGDSGFTLDSSYRLILSGICRLSDADADLLEPIFSEYEKKVLQRGSS